MITRSSGYLALSEAPVPTATAQLQREGYAILKSVFDQDALDELRRDVERVFREYPPDVRSKKWAADHWTPFRYEMFNRSGPVQAAIAAPRILETIEPLLGEDCHVIANTAWWQPPTSNEHGGRYWHIDSGPHVPRAAGIPWDERIPYPVFAVASHIFLIDCPLEAGPTGVIPRSHTSGQAPPLERAGDEALDWDGHRTEALVAEAGDVALFVSDVWHRRLAPLQGDPGRMFVQCHYGRRDLAQRVRTTAEANHTSGEAATRAVTPRQRKLIGLHPPGFYDG